MRKLLCVFILSLFISVSFYVKQGTAAVEIDKLQNVFDKVTLGAHLTAFYRVDENTFFGADITPKEGEDTDFGETWASISLTAKKDIGWTKLEAQIAPYFVETIGQDFYPAYKDESDFDMDQAWLKFNELFDSSFDLKVGRQDIKIEKWFVMGDGETQQAALWNAWHYSFPFAVRLDGDLGPIKMTSFWAKTSDYYQSWSRGIKSDLEVTGINFHYDIFDSTYVYAGYYRKFDNSNAKIPKPNNPFRIGVYTPQGKVLEDDNDTNVFDIGFDSNISNLHLAGEFVYQTGDAGSLNGEDRDRQAMAYFGRATYNFPVKFSPFIRGQYTYFSGDDDYEDDEAKNYDPMFIGFKGWNQWIMGELVGEAHLPNTNKKVAIASAGFSPVKRMKATFMYLNHKLDENYYLYPAIETKSDDWADEFNLLVDYGVSKNLFAHVGLGYVVPDDAAEQVMGDDKNAYFGQVLLDFRF